MLLDLFITFLRISLFTIGGGYAMIPLFQRELVDVHGWLTPEQMLDMLAVAEMTPGALSVNLATYAGFHQAGFWGAVSATLGLAAPSILLVFLVVMFLQRWREHPVVQAVLTGIRPMVVALILVASLSIARVALGSWPQYLLLVLAGIASIRYNTHPMLVIAAAGLAGILLF